MVQRVRENIVGESAIETIKVSIPTVRLRATSSFIFPTAYSGRKQTAAGRRLFSRVVTWLVRGELALPILFIVKHLAKYRSKRVKTVPRKRGTWIT